MYERLIQLIEVKQQRRLAQISASRTCGDSLPARLVFDAFVGIEGGWLVLYRLYCEGETIERRCAFVTDERDNKVAWDNLTYGGI